MNGTAQNPLEATRDALGRASDALKRATDYNKAGYRVKALADVEAAINHLNASINSKGRADSVTASNTATMKPDFNLAQSERGYNPSMDSALDNLSQAFGALNRVPAADLGEFRTLITNDIAAAARDIIAGIYAAKDYRESRESALKSDSAR
jgi:hypothetical protein